MAATRELSFISHNDTADETLILLHGMFCSHLAFNGVIAYLRNYHLLLVDLPAHSGSASITPFTLLSAVKHVASIIAKWGHGGRAHVVGTSAGGFVGIQLAISHPEVVSSLWVTGSTPFTGWQRWIVTHPGLLYIFTGMTAKWLPRWLYDHMCANAGIMPHTALKSEIEKNFSYQLMRSGYQSCAELEIVNCTKLLAESRVRTLVVAGELVDDVMTTTEMGERLQAQGSKACGAAIVMRAMHPWELQFPQLFAQSITAWIAGQVQPPGIKVTVSPVI